MSLYQTVLNTVINDVQRLTLSYNQTLLHGEPTNAEKTRGHTAQSQWFHIFLAAVSAWCDKNPTVSQVPATFLPSENEEINRIMTGQPDPTESDAAPEGE